MKLEAVGYYNGEMGLPEDIKAPILDRAFYFGDGCYDATYLVNNKILFLEDHIDRIFNSMRLLKINPPCDREEMAKILYEVADAFEGENGFLYLQVSRGTARRSHAFPEGMKSNFMVTLEPADLTDPEKTFKVVTAEDKRFLYCNIKTLNLLPNVLEVTKAHNAGAEELIFHRGNTVTEMGHSSVSMIVGDEYIIHPFDEKILPSVAAKRHLCKLAESVGLKAVEREFSLTELMNADEVIIASSGTLCNRIVEVDGIPVGGKADESFKKLQKAAWDEVKAYCDLK